MDSIHGHEVMRMMVGAPRPFTEEALEAAVVKQFGGDARFHTCSAEDMTARELIHFLKARDKFIITREGLSMAQDNICDHED